MTRRSSASSPETLAAASLAAAANTVADLFHKVANSNSWRPINKIYALSACLSTLFNFSVDHQHQRLAVLTDARNPGHQVAVLGDLRLRAQQFLPAVCLQQPK